MTAGRLPFAFGNVRTALMPPPYRIILGTNPVDFISAIQPPRETKSLLSRQAYPSGPRFVKQTRAGCPDSIMSLYLRHGLERRREHRRRFDDYWTEKRFTAHR